MLRAPKDLTSVPHTEASRFWGNCKTSGQPAITSERPYLRFGAQLFRPTGSADFCRFTPARRGDHADRVGLVPQPRRERGAPAGPKRTPRTDGSESSNPESERGPVARLQVGRAVAADLLSSQAAQYVEATARFCSQAHTPAAAAAAAAHNDPNKPLTSFPIVDALRVHAAAAIIATGGHDEGAAVSLRRGASVQQARDTSAQKHFRSDRNGWEVVCKAVRSPGGNGIRTCHRSAARARNLSTRTWRACSPS